MNIVLTLQKLKHFKNSEEEFQKLKKGQQAINSSDKF